MGKLLKFHVMHAVYTAVSGKFSSFHSCETVLLTELNFNRTLYLTLMSIYYRNDLETAVYVLKKTMKLAQTKSLQAEGHLLLRTAYQKRGETKLAEEEGKLFVSLCEEPSPVLCETLISLAETAEPAEKVVFLADCRTVASRLKGDEKVIYIYIYISYVNIVNLDSTADGLFHHILGAGSHRRGSSLSEGSRTPVGGAEYPFRVAVNQAAAYFVVFE